MNISCGTDIIEIERIKKSIIDLEDKFLNKIFTEKEITYCMSKKNQRYQHFAARFAAKEAVFKSISKKVNNKLEWKNIEITNDINGKPYVNLKYDIKEIENIDISISHCKEYAVATAIVIFS